MGRNYNSGMVYNALQNQSTTQKILGLDALRTLAIVGVTLFHMFPDVIMGGYLGVSLFFVLTGYLLAYTSENEWNEGRFSILNYYKKRFNRIYPSLVIVIFTTIGVCSFLTPKAIEAVRPEIISVLLGYNNWWQIAQNADYFTRLTNNSPFTHLWFMGIELQYYLVWPLIFLLYTWIFKLFGKKTGIGFIAALGIVTAVLMPIMYQPDTDVTRLYYGTDTRIYALFFGAAMGFYRSGYAYPKYKLKKTGRINSLIYVLLIGVTLEAYLLMDGQSSFTYLGGMLIMTLLFCQILRLTANPDFAIGRLLDNALFRWIGRRSYGIFLWQYPVIYLFNHLGWNELPVHFAGQLLIIVLLTLWSDALADCIVKRRIPLAGNRLIVVQCVAFAMITFTGVFFMGYGCRGVVASAEYKADDKAELQAKLQENAAELDKQNTAPVAEAPKEPTADDLSRVKLDGVVCIGDSVLLGSSRELRKSLPTCYIDAEVSRYVGGGLDVAKSMNEQGRLGNIVVIALGTNGPIAGQERYEVQTRALLEYLGNKRQIFWVNVYCPELKWQSTNNAYIEKIAAEHSNVTVVDWYGLISKHPEWLVKDGIHPNDEGCVQYAKLIHDTMARTMANKK